MPLFHPNLIQRAKSHENRTQPLYSNASHDLFEPQLRGVGVVVLVTLAVVMAAGKLLLGIKDEIEVSSEAAKDMQAACKQSTQEMSLKNYICYYTYPLTVLSVRGWGWEVCIW